MPKKVTPKEFTQLFVSAFMSADLDTFVSHVLGKLPITGDSWQEEKFLAFQRAGSALARLSLEHVEAIIAYAQSLRS